MPAVGWAVDDNVSVDVNVTTLTEITVTPIAINWTQITPGTAGGQRLLDIRNTGSVNVTNIYSYISTLVNETSRPYLSADADSYAAGGVLVFHNESDSNFYWAGKLEWNWTEPINNIVYPSSFPVGNRPAQGFFRNASTSFVWALRNGTGGLCNNSGALFAIEDDPDDGSNFTRSPDETSITRNSGDQNWSYFSINRGSNFLNGQCVAVNSYCDRIFVYKYDKRANFSSCANSEFVYANNLVPNQIERITADVWVPKGIPAGNLKSSVWTFVAS